MTGGAVLAVIPARGGSRGIPRKNLQLVGGRPLVVHSVEAALDARLVDRTVVSTDDPEIAAVARAAGAEVVERPAELASDTAPTEPTLEHAVTVVESRGASVGLVVLLQPTSPRRPRGLVDRCIERLRAERADSLLTVCRTHAFFWRRRGTGVEASYDYQRRPRRQDIPESDVWFRENGSVYVTRRDLLMRAHNRLGGRILIEEMPEEDSWEIDSPMDLWLHQRLDEWFRAADEQRGTRG